MKAFDIVGYTFNADNYCPDDIVQAVSGGCLPHGFTAEDALNILAAERGVNRSDEHSFDSGDFPKVIFASMVESDDDRCGACHEPLIGD